jgi:hypothetical protein
LFLEQYWKKTKAGYATAAWLMTNRANVSPNLIFKMQHLKREATCQASPTLKPD